MRYSRLFWTYLQKHGEKANNLSIKIYVNKIENSITFRIKPGHYFELLMHETIKLLKSFENKIANDKNGENLLK